MSSSPIARTSRVHTRRRRSSTPPHNNRKRTLRPRKAAKRRAPSQEPSEGSASDDQDEYISIAESEDSDSEIDQLETTPSPRKAPVRRTKVVPDDELTPRRRAKRRHYSRNQEKLREESRLRMRAHRARMRNQLPDGAAAKGKKKQVVPRKKQAGKRDSSPGSSSAGPRDKTLNWFLQGLDGFSPITGGRLRRAVEQCLDLTPSPISEARAYLMEDDTLPDAEEYEDEECHVLSGWDFQDIEVSGRDTTPPQIDDPDDLWKHIRDPSPAWDDPGNEYRLYYGSPSHAHMRFPPRSPSSPEQRLSPSEVRSQPADLPREATTLPQIGFPAENDHSSSGAAANQANGIVPQARSAMESIRRRFQLW